MIRKVAEFESAAIAGFAAIGGAAITMADKTAMADQDFRLLALHMYTSIPVARELKIGLDALGATMEDVMYDPELARRFQQLVDAQVQMTKGMPDFEANMEKIRDMRFEFTKFGVELEYLRMHVLNDLMRAFGPQFDMVLTKLREWNVWIMAHMPEISDWIADKLVPVLNDAKDVMGLLWDVSKEVCARVYEPHGNADWRR